MLVHTFLIIISAWQCTEVETEGGGGAERWAESFYLTPWDDVKSPTSLPPPTPSSLPYAEELATGFVWGVGVMTERTHMHAVSPPSSKMENNRYFCFWGTTQDCAQTTKRTTSPAWGDSVISKQHSAGKKELTMKVWGLRNWNMHFLSPHWNSWLPEDFLNSCDEEVVVRASSWFWNASMSLYTWHSILFYSSLCWPATKLCQTRSTRNNKDCFKRWQKQTVGQLQTLHSKLSKVFF